MTPKEPKASHSKPRKKWRQRLVGVTIAAGVVGVVHMLSGDDGGGQPIGQPASSPGFNAQTECLRRLLEEEGPKVGSRRPGRNSADVVDCISASAWNVCTKYAADAEASRRIFRTSFNNCMKDTAKKVRNNETDLYAPDELEKAEVCSLLGSAMSQFSILAASGDLAVVVADEAKARHIVDVLGDDLSSDERDVVLRKFITGDTVPQVAAAMDLDEWRAKSLYDNGLRKMKATATVRCPTGRAAFDHPAESEDGTEQRYRTPSYEQEEPRYRRPADDLEEPSYRHPSYEQEEPAGQDDRDDDDDPQ
jgi:DNA-directed RNA polymerase specialized sigma24 family protein